MKTTRLVSTNPSRNFEVLGDVEISSESEVKAKVLAARTAQPKWQAMGVEKRIQHMRKLIPLFEKNRNEFIKRTSAEMGMPQGLSTAMAEGAIG